MEKWKTRSIANNYKKLAHWNLPIESYERWLLWLFYLGWIVTFASVVTCVEMWGIDTVIYNCVVLLIIHINPLLGCVDNVRFHPAKIWALPHHVFYVFVCYLFYISDRYVFYNIALRSLVWVAVSYPVFNWVFTLRIQLFELWYCARINGGHYIFPPEIPTGVKIKRFPSSVPTEKYPESGTKSENNAGIHTVTSCGLCLAFTKEWRKYNFNISVTDIVFDGYLGEWNYRAILKVKTWSCFLTIPKCVS